MANLFNRKNLHELQKKLDISKVIECSFDIKPSEISVYTSICPACEKHNSLVFLKGGKNCHCFSCGWSGDCVDFLIKTRELNFEDVIRLLAVMFDVKMKNINEDELIEKRINSLNSCVNRGDSESLLHVISVLIKLSNPEEKE